VEGFVVGEFLVPLDGPFAAHACVCDAGCSRRSGFAALVIFGVEAARGGGLAVAEGVSDYAGRVEVWEHFRTQRIDEFGDVVGELGTARAELDESVGGSGVQGEDEWS
jgi:hypothetical protein